MASLTTATDQNTLAYYSFLSDYNAHRQALVGVARVVYITVSLLFSSPAALVFAQPIDCEDALTDSLLATSVFSAILNSKSHAPRVLHRVFARAMARHILDNAWPDIILP